MSAWKVWYVSLLEPVFNLVSCVFSHSQKRMCVIWWVATGKNVLTNHFLKWYTEIHDDRHYKNHSCIWAFECQFLFCSFSLFTCGWPKPARAKRKIKKKNRGMSERVEEEDMRRPLVSQTEEGRGENGKSITVYILPRQCSHSSSISVQPVFSLSHRDCRKMCDLTNRWSG